MRNILSPLKPSLKAFSSENQCEKSAQICLHFVFGSWRILNCWWFKHCSKMFCTILVGSAVNEYCQHQSSSVIVIYAIQYLADKDLQVFYRQTSLEHEVESWVKTIVIISPYFPRENILNCETRCQISILKWYETLRYNVQSGLMWFELEKQQKFVNSWTLYDSFWLFLNYRTNKQY